ncbi:MAG: diguanylate cyclase [Anaerolineaceae bacterium]|nr:MAG: diguanylate cyclase [Anaerolineaceae bacterium]
MGDFAYVSIIALFCYLFLFIIFFAAKKNKIVFSFLFILGAFILWTAGSFCMRIQLWPSVKFWYDISILGLTLLPLAFLVFVGEYANIDKLKTLRIWIPIIVGLNIINISKGFFLSAPNVHISPEGKPYFVYSYTWPVVLFFGIMTAIVINMLYILMKASRQNQTIKKQFTPIVLGILVLFLGHVFILLPTFRGFPTDILSGVINAFFMFYALYKRKLFQLKMIMSKGSCLVISAILSYFIFFHLIDPLNKFINNKYAISINQNIWLVAILITLVTGSIYAFMQFLFHLMFIRDEIIQADSLKDFSYKVSKTLNVQEILRELVSVIQNTIYVKNIKIYISNNKKAPYEIVHNTKLSDKPDLKVSRNNILAKWLEDHNECILIKDFKKTNEYKSLAKKWKDQISEMKIECVVPLRDDDAMIGFIVLSEKEKKSRYTYKDISFLNSINSIGSIAIKNSKLYEKVYYEARTDELTGLLNRKYFYEVLNEEYEKNKNAPIALIILNIDDFRLYNQLYGTKEGDIALQKIAKSISDYVSIDGFVARYGGKEFAVILPYYDSFMAKQIADEIRKRIHEINKREKDYSLKALTVSGGISSIPYSANSIKELVDNADMAVYNVKRNGKNAIMMYTAGTDNMVGIKSPISRKSIYSEYAPTIYALTAAIDTKDHYTFSHSQNVEYYASGLAYAYGMNEDCIEIIREAALLHDIGKIGIPENILNKPGRLSREEYEIMKGHVENAVAIIRHLPSLDYVIPAVIGHHERYDGNGYPRRIAGEDIPLYARILCIADSFDAIISKRPYKDADTVDSALQILEEQSGLQFDPELIKVFVRQVKNGNIRVYEEN